MSVDATDRRIAVDDLINAARAFESLKIGDQLTPAAEDFITQMAQDATEDDVQGLSPPDLAALAASFWRWTAQKRADSQDIRLIEGKGQDGRALGRDVLEICGPDMAYLVDSIMGEIGAQGVEVHAMFHPIIQVCRDPDGIRGENGVSFSESMIQVHLPPVAPSKRDAILMGVRETLADVRMAMADAAAMKSRMNNAIKDLAIANTKASSDEIGETISFLKWLGQGHFIFFGVRSYDYARSGTGALSNDEPDIREDLNLGILRDPLRMVLRRLNEPSVLTSQVRSYLEEPAPIIIAKSNLRSRIHRRAVMDYISVKRYNESGDVLGEDRFLGLFTDEAYDQVVRDVPLLRGKVDRVIAGAQLVPGSHNDKRFRNIVENYPRDELFQIEEADLLRIALGVQHLMDRPRAKMFVRRDRFDRFLSILVFVPRDRYNTNVRARIGALLANAYQGRLSAFYPQFGDTPLARVHFIIGVTPNQHHEPNIEDLEAQIATITRTWEDGVEALGEGDNAIVARYLAGFPAGYQERFDAAEALKDIAELEQLSDDQVRVRAYVDASDDDKMLRAKIYKAGHATALSAAVPIFESMGLYVESETPYEVTRTTETGDQCVWVQDVRMRTASGATLNYDSVEASFEQAFTAIWAGQAENDAFNRLILNLGVSWRDAALIRALARWRGQTGLDPSEAVQQQAVANYPDITRAILDLFKARFDPDFGNKKAREIASKDLNATITMLLDAVPNLDTDRVLRRLVGLVNVMMRTNFYQVDANGNPKAYMSFKIAPRELLEVPAPKPFREIWVWSPKVEGAHLRFGPVARGGLRWSDRRDDFRTEVLGLVKAQQVKNAVIVPVGSKGAFFPKALPQGGTRDEIQVAAIEAYKIFLCGLLDLTDNIDADGTIVAPKNAVRWDGDDPYLVVAADKGTATFSDIANGISADYGHWLGDAFASGGSVGYDHKKMGITAKGAWEAVKRHFREMSMDTQSQDFSVIGVGDMSGDVFGNGMLLSDNIKLIAAFDHRDIFIDPNPDVAKSFKERQRMFALPRSSWADYDKSLISQGGGVFSRSAKSIDLTPELKAITGLEGEEAAPSEIMHALLKAKCDLMWFGGIGTYVKASSETDGDAGDKANDAIRVDGRDLRCKVIGEGANLGLTQRGRIEAAQSGVRLNTDAIDNSAGVDSSDHEVNIKILLNGVVRTGAMTKDGRDVLLAEMTSDVAAHVLAHNYAQTATISLQETTAKADLDAHERFIESLEKAGRLDRKVEYLPSSDGFRARRSAGLGLTRPELSVLTAYSKLSLFDELIASDAPDDPWFEDVLISYFPQGCHQFSEAMGRHRLRREIIATVMSNKIVDRGGSIFMDRVRESGSVQTASIVRGFAAAKRVFDLDAILGQINALDLKIGADTQAQMHLSVNALLQRQCFWFARQLDKGDIDGPKSVSDLVSLYDAPVSTLTKLAYDLLSTTQKAALELQTEALRQQQVPSALAKTITTLKPLINATDIIDISTGHKMPLEGVARLYNGIGSLVGLDELQQAANTITTNDHWDHVAMRRLVEELRTAQGILTGFVCRSVSQDCQSGTDVKWAKAALDTWAQTNKAPIEQTRTAIKELQSSNGGWSFAKLAIISNQIKELARTVV